MAGKKTETHMLSLDIIFFPENKWESFFTFTSDSARRRVRRFKTSTSRPVCSKRTKFDSKASGKKPVRKFVCLADKDQSCTPHFEEYRELLIAGSGESKLSIPEEADEEEIRKIILQNFPTLKDGGGFKLMYAESRNFERPYDHPSRSIWKHQYEIFNFIYWQGKIFFRPIQQDVDTSAGTHTLPSGRSLTPEETCHKCNMKLSVHQLRDYYAKYGEPGEFTGFSKGSRPYPPTARLASN